MHSATNVKLGKKEDRSLMYVHSLRPLPAALKQEEPCRTGTHTVADVFCIGCEDRIGWYYHKASDQSQKYKEGACQCIRYIWRELLNRPRAGKYLLERERLMKVNEWKLDEE